MKNTKKKFSSAGNSLSHHEFFLFEPKTLAIIIVTSVLTLLIAFFGEQGGKFLTSVISTVPAHAPYDGLTFPVKQMPNWVKLTEAERKMTYNQLPPEKLISIAAYNPTHLAIPVSMLKWNDPADDAIRNEKITYSVPYLGSYKLDGLENSGSHPAIDIKIPNGTPIYAIANGTVTKTTISSGGFGNHIVIQHNNFPSFDDKNKLVTLYSSYNHLSSISVNMNDVVTKGQLIGFSGETGTATTPHLHFQIDTDNSAWHPYWPFTTADMNSAGYSFFEAINHGLGQQNAVANTINPMKYVQAYSGDQSILVTSNPALTQALSTVDKYENVSFAVQIVGSTNKIIEGDTLKVIVQAFDAEGNLLSKPDFKDDVKLSLLNGNGVLNRNAITASNLRTGISNHARISDLKLGKDKVILRFREKEFSSQEFEITPKVSTVASFKVVLDRSEIKLNEIVQASVLALDASGNSLNDFVLDENPAVGQSSALGSLSQNSLTRDNFSNGTANVSFTSATPGETQIVINYHGAAFQSPTVKVLPPPDPEPVVVAPEVVVETPAQPEVVTPIVETQPVVVETPVQPEVAPIVETQPVVVETPVQPVTPVPEPVVTPVVTAKPLPFTDIPETNIYFEALTELKTSGLVAGYADGTFQPDSKVSRAEAITFILRAINETIREKIEAKFPDVPMEIWFAKYVSTAFELGFVKGYPDGYFRPQAEVTLSEFFTMIFVAAKVDIDPQIQITLPTGVDAAAWYAPYIQEAIRRNILEIKDSALDPSRSMTRGEIALILYRLQQLEKEGNGL
ncbi:MAG: S-layer homology domain-containing protein [Candidatus Gracilibacteria bacterium]